MKTTSLLLAAAGIGQTVATFGNFGGFKGFRGANPFTCPDNTDNKCKGRQERGFDWTDLIPGNSDFDYDGFRFRGFKCLDDQRGRPEIEGECGPDRATNPSFEHDEGFSVDELEVFPEFDTDLEFVYDMPSGKTCKQRARCSKNGTKVKNTQCGGAKKVTVCHPRQPQRPKEKCKIRIPKIDFNCKPPKPTKPPVETPTVPVDTPTPTPDLPETTPGLPETTPPAEPSEAPEESTTAGVPGTTEEVEVPGTTEAPEVPGTSVVSSSSPEESGPASVPESPEDSTTAGVPGVPGTTDVPEVPETIVSSSSPEESTPIVETITTSHMTTSTIFTTTVSTVTSCAPEIPECPGDGETAVVTVTVPFTTTVCPVTEVITTTHGVPGTPGTPVPEPSIPAPGTSDSSPEGPETPAPEPSVPAPSNSVPAPPAETPLPCPEVVPSCMNTWLFDVGCKDNTDTACLCPNAVFVQNVFNCIYANGETDSIVSEAIVFFQGICAGHVPDNDAIVTGIDSITSVITPGPKPTVPAGYTTVIVTVTTEVPCVTDGVTISGSSTTTIIEQTAEIPNVGFQTDSQGVVDVVPITPQPIVQPTAPGVVPTVPGAIAPTGGSPGTFVSVPRPTGTNDASPIETGFVEAGAGRKAATGFGLAFAVVAGAAALL